MSPTKRAAPRKTPRQERAKATVEVLLEAAAQVLVSSGYEGTTTKEVAERAGVSIGTLYQYFPSKEALVAALAERWGRRVVEMVTTQLEPRPDEGIEQRVRRMVHALVGLYTVNPRLQQVLGEQVPRLGLIQGIQDAEARMESLLSHALSRNLELVRPRDLRLSVFMLIRAVRGAIWAAVVERPEMVGDPALEEELSALVLGFLRRPAPPPPSSSSG